MPSSLSQSLHSEEPHLPFAETWWSARQPHHEASKHCSRMKEHWQHQNSLHGAEEIVQTFKRSSMTQFLFLKRSICGQVLQ